ncbi:MAG: hypothetical protein LBI80_04425 [Endomicrobium sp.]|jgi:hypothetical protein|nr:hypothetical protein [Endomicrobium sp.]
MKKNILLVVLFLFFSSSCLFAAIHKEMGASVGFPSGKTMDGAGILSLDSCFCIGERENSKQKSVKEKLGWRISASKIKRKNDKIENSKVEYTSLKFIEIVELIINEKVSFNVKGLFGLGGVYSQRA